jgi:hypothetical protein
LRVSFPSVGVYQSKLSASSTIIAVGYFTVRKISKYNVFEKLTSTDAIFEKMRLKGVSDTFPTQVAR